MTDLSRIKAVFGACALAIAASSATGHAATVVTSGFISTDNPFNFVLNPGEDFVLNVGTAAINAALLMNFETGQLISSFYVQTGPGAFIVGIGPDDTVLSCNIAAGGSCTDSDFGPVGISLAESGGLISGGYTFGPPFYTCFAPGQTPADGVECGRDFSFLPRMLFDLTFAVGGQSVPYTLSITSGSGGVPEPQSWALLILGFGAMGIAMRRRTQIRVTYT